LSKEEILRFQELIQPFREWVRSPENSPARKSKKYRVCLISEVEMRPWDDTMREPLYQQCDKCRLARFEWNATMRSGCGSYFLFAIAIATAASFVPW
jgi:hypothetical protein